MSRLISSIYRQKRKPKKIPAKQFAAQMRNNPTSCERRMWKALRDLGLGFKRQVPIGSYIVDFVSKRERLVIEVDGPHHDQQKLYDARRDHNLSRMFYEVWHFRWDEDYSKIPERVRQRRNKHQHETVYRKVRPPQPFKQSPPQ